MSFQTKYRTSIGFSSSSGALFCVVILSHDITKEIVDMINLIPLSVIHTSSTWKETYYHFKLFIDRRVVAFRLLLKLQKTYLSYLSSQILSISLSPQIHSKSAGGRRTLATPRRRRGVVINAARFNHVICAILIDGLSGTVSPSVIIFLCPRLGPS